MGLISGWLLVYLIGSVPILAFYAVGLSGWLFDYPWSLMVAIFLVFSVPPILLILRVSSAPAWNIVLLWVSAGLISVRSLHAAFQMNSAAILAEGPTLVIIVAVALFWAIAWTKYFLVSNQQGKTSS